MSYAYLFTILLGGLAALDATPVAQTLLSQPLVTATLIGALWGDLPTALEVGVVLQILAASTMPVGSRTGEDYAVGGVVGAAVAVALAAEQPFVVARDACALLGVLAGLVSAMVGVALLKWQRRRNEGLSRWCEDALRHGSEGALAQAHGAAVVLAFGVGVSYCAVCVGASVWSMRGLAGNESLWLARAWALAKPLWLGLGLAQVLNAFLQRRLTRAAVFGAALIGAWLVLLVGAP
ncbi:MAG TPA: PTS sugar transporter subunit IIC [Candidatus Limnocylindria bacterium]|nr:PTS sugar transporter subunit IIC [Candidatus Limnocylindria bacterium]